MSNYAKIPDVQHNSVELIFIFLIAKITTKRMIKILVQYKIERENLKKQY
ncbi:MAG: hypothetical protein HPY57_09410 [Ignavibacteria bacterium]|nr:hypothetical protein [Ignavibacteria bacterium]